MDYPKYSDGAFSFMNGNLVMLSCLEARNHGMEILQMNETYEVGCEYNIHSRTSW
jgi:hypothetical protein